MGVQTFWLEKTDRFLVGLRRYSHHGDGWTCADGYHSAIAYTGQIVGAYDDNNIEVDRAPNPPHDDPAWPTHCGCGYEFAADDEWQPWQESIWRRTDTGEERVMRPHTEPCPIPTAEPGASWDASWLHYKPWCGADGIALMVRCPDGHDWTVDSRPSNCTLPDDDVHKCWIRHGDPRECKVTVDKAGVTCSAGAGSIQTPNWHGFLRGGELVE